MSRRPAVWMPALALLLAACGAGWHRVDDLSPEELPPRQQVQIWVEDRSRVLHAVALGSDSITGIPFHRPLDCDSCRVAIARSSVDSMRLGNQERGLLRSIGAGYVMVAVGSWLAWLIYSGD